MLAAILAMAACFCLGACGGTDETGAGETVSEESFFTEETWEVWDTNGLGELSQEELGLLTMMQALDTEVVDLPEGEDGPVEAPAASLRENLHAGPESEFFYDQLTEEEQETYDLILAGLRNMEEGEIDLTITDTDRIQEIVQYVLMDDPGLFWYYSYSLMIYSRGDEVVRVAAQFAYNCDQAERDRRQPLIDAAVEEILAGAPSGEEADDYAKIRYVYEYIVRNTDYDINAEDSQNICSVFLDHVSVCQGYSLAAQYLLNRMGVDCVTVTGEAAGGLHAWNLVWADGEPYYMDVTWGDPQNVLQRPDGADVGGEDDAGGEGSGDEDAAEGGNDTSANIELVYNYLLVTSEELERTHRPDGVFTLPAASATADNYYVREDLYMESWDPAKFVEIAGRYIPNGEYTFSIKFATREAFEEACSALFEGSGVWRYLDGVPGAANLNSLSYSPPADAADDLDMYIITLHFFSANA